MADYRTVTACRLCDSTQLTRALDLGQTPLANELDGTELFPLVVNRCDDCGHHQLSIAVSAERLWGPSYPYQSGTSPVFRKHLEELADEVAALKPGGDFIEIASNDGTLVRLLHERGMSGIGVDPSGPDDPGAGLHAASWPPRANEMRYDVILALNVFAHVDDLHGFTAAVKEALAPDGVFIVEVGYLPEQILRGQFDTIYAEHLSYHSLSPLEGFFRRHGLVIDSAAFNESQGGTLRLCVRHVDAEVDWNERKNWDDILDCGADASLLRSVIDSRAAVLREALNRLFQRDEMVCIYGAPAKLTTLLYATGLEKMPFNCVGDDNPRKVGRTTPGNRIPIVSVEEMLARKPDSVLIASWNFAPDICKRLREAGFKGSIVNPMSHRA